MRVWIHGRNRQDTQPILAYCLEEGYTVVGVSDQTDAQAFFPQGGLAQAMQAAIRRAFDLLLISNFELLGRSAEQMEEMQELFHAYQISVKSASSLGSRSS